MWDLSVQELMWDSQVFIGWFWFTTGSSYRILQVGRIKWMRGHIIATKKANSIKRKKMAMAPNEKDIRMKSY